jgi:Flp pilus assembly protein TadB
MGLGMGNSSSSY